MEKNSCPPSTECQETAARATAAGDACAVNAQGRVQRVWTVCR